jgi:hypothetical protein
MVKPLPAQKYIGLFLILFTLGSSVKATNRIFAPAGSSGVWSNASNWSPVGIPSSSDEITIASGKSCILDLSLALDGKITVESGASLILNEDLSLLSSSMVSINAEGVFDATGRTLTFSGNASIGGVIENDQNTNLIFSGMTGSIPVLSQSGIGNLTIDGFSDVSLSVDLRVSGSLNLNPNSRLQVLDKELSVSTWSSSIVLSPGSNGSVLELVGNGNFVLPALNCRSLLSRTTGSVTATGPIRIASLLENQSQFTLNGNLDCLGSIVNSGTFTTGNASVATLNSNSPDLLNNSGTLQLNSNLVVAGGNGTIRNSGTLTTSAGKGILFTGSGSPSISLGSPTEIGQLVVNKTNGTVTLEGSAALSIGDQVSVLAGTLDLAGNPLILRSTAGGTARIGQILGTLTGATKVTVERYIPGTASGWYFLGTSNAGQSIKNWADDFEIRGPFPEAGVSAAASQSTLYQFDGASSSTGTEAGEVNGWRIPTSATLQPGKGYRAYLRTSFFAGDPTVRNTGSVVQGNFDFQPEFNPAGYGGGGWNFLANPYPSQMDWNSPNWTKTNIGNTIYIWNGQTGQYGAYNFANDPPGTNPGTNGVSNIIASGQAFFVKATGPSPVLSTTEGVKSSFGASFIRENATPSSTMRLRLENALGFSDENVIRFHESGSVSFDPENDAYKMAGTNVNLSTITPEGTKLCINTLPRITEDGVVVPLSTSSFTTGKMSLRFSGFGEEAAQLKMFLFDRYNNVLTPVEEGSVYSFSLTADPASKEEGRLQLYLSRSREFPNRQEAGDFTLTSFQSSGYDGKLAIKAFNGKPGSGILRLTDMAGKELFWNEMDRMEISDYSLPLNLQNGIYLLEWIQDGRKYPLKTWIRN